MGASGKAEPGIPMTAEDCVGSSEPEPGREVQFCPIRGLPILRGQRVRALPGFHLLSLDAGKEALARGSYEAFGKQFECKNLEYLHSDDKIFICAEDHKAFFNQMSMQYHRYIRHELEDRKAERKRLRERYEERKVRSAAHAAQRQQQAQQEVRLHQEEALRQDAPQVAAVPPGESAAARTSAAAQAGIHAAAQLIAGAGDRATHDPYAATDDPYAATPAEAAPEPAAAGAPEVVGSVASAAATAPAAAPKRAAPAAAESEDLYGDVVGEGKRQKTTSTYANAIGAMLGDDFDEDE